MAGRYALSFALTAFTASLFAQPAGDALFDTDQVIELRFTFPQVDFWAQLTTYYEAGEETSIPAALSITDLSGTYALDSVGVRLKGNSSYDFYPG
ncbi:MAG TPA: hypothetical protein VHL57_05215, partial [Flavobacteriales bacterium]|nr:hypothetical protein [Flavobacteriales bacterium]